MSNKKDQMSRELRDPTKDEYLAVEKKLGAAEYDLADAITAGNQAFDDAADAAREHIKSPIGDIRPSRGDDRG